MGCLFGPTTIELPTRTPLASTAEYSRIAARLNTVQNEGRPVTVGLGRSAVLARRRRALATLAIAAGTSLVLALTTRQLGWLFAHIVIDAGIAWYVAVLLQIKQTRNLPVVAPLAPRVAEYSDQPVRVVAS